MLRKLRRNLSFANVTSLLALFVALGGTTAYAADTVFSSDIVDGQVKTPDLASPAVTNNKLAANAVTTGKVAADTLGAVDLAPGSVGSSEVTDHALTGADIVESTLVGVDAETVDGGNLCRSEGAFRMFSDDPPVTVCTSGSLALIARCTKSDAATVATLALDASADFNFVTSGATDDAQFDAADHPVTLVTVSDNATLNTGSVWKGDTSFAAGNRADQSQLSGSATAWATHSSISSSVCRFVVGATD